MKWKRSAAGQPPFSPIRSGPKAASKPFRQKQFPSSRPDSRPRRQLTGKKLGDLKKPLPEKTLARRTGNLRSHATKTVLKFPGSSKIWHGSGAFPAEIPTTAKPNHHLSPSFPRNPLSPHLRSLQRRPQAPHAKSKFLAVLVNLARRPSESGNSSEDKALL